MIDKDNFDWFILMSLFFITFFYSFCIIITVGTNTVFFMTMIVDVIMMIAVNWAGQKVSH